MDGKFILLFVICASIFSGLFSFACIENNSACGESLTTNIIVQFFVIDPSENWASFGGLEVDGVFSEEVDGMLQAEASGVGITEGIGLLIDGLKMVLAILSFLTPIPMIIFFNSLAMPYWLNLIISGPLFLLYIFSVMEFLTGRQF